MRLVLVDAHVFGLEAFIEHFEDSGRDLTDLLILVRH